MHDTGDPIQLGNPAGDNRASARSPQALTFCFQADLLRRLIPRVYDQFGLSHRHPSRTEQQPPAVSLESRTHCAPRQLRFVNGLPERHQT